MLTAIDDNYIDLSISNVEQSDVSKRTLCQFNQSSTQPLLKDTTHYKLSIIRFLLNTQSLPIFIPQLQPNEKNKTIYSVTMEYENKQFQQFMEFEPQLLNPSEQKEYYYVMNYQWVIYLVNKCFQSCLEGLQNLISLHTQTPPKMTLDNQTKFCSLFMDSTYYGYNENNKINVYMNLHMYGLFTSLPNVVCNKQKLGMDFQINNKISDDPNNLSQEYSTTGLWSPISSIVFCTNLMPVNSTIYPPTQKYVNGNLNTNSTYNSLNIITDFIASDLNFSTNGFLIYESQNNRYISLKDKQQLKNIDVNIYWINKLTGDLNNVYLAPNSFSSIKILLTNEMM